MYFPDTLHSVRGNFCSAEERSNNPCISRAELEESLLQVFSGSQKGGNWIHPILDLYASFHCLLH